jgi:hypothetical protein
LICPLVCWHNAAVKAITGMLSRHVLSCSCQSGAMRTALICTTTCIMPEQAAATWHTIDGAVSYSY